MAKGASWARQCNKLSPSHSFTRAFTIQTHERVPVRCGSTDPVHIDVYNIASHPPTTPLVVYLPPRPSVDRVPAPPSFLEKWPVAVINYQWTKFGSQPRGPRWPVPVHQTALSFAWIVKSLLASPSAKRDVYIHGAHLGASLATSLALTESHYNTSWRVRGLIACNGVYNWTMFLPDHRINKPSKRSKTKRPPHRDERLDDLQAQLPALFGKPDNLFDAFASPSLFFHGPGLYAPESFHLPAELSRQVTALTSVHDDATSMTPPKQPRKSHLLYPPRQSTLKLPPSLFLYQSAGPKGNKKSTVNSLQSQAEELASLMRRSIEKKEIRDAQIWSPEKDISTMGTSAYDLVHTFNMGLDPGGVEVGEEGQAAILDWMKWRDSETSL